MNPEISTGNSYCLRISDISYIRCNNFWNLLSRDDCYLSNDMTGQILFCKKNPDRGNCITYKNTRKSHLITHLFQEIVDKRCQVSDNKIGNVEKHC